MNVRLPARFCARELVNYEVETARAIHDWVVNNPGGIFVDIGCSYGYFSCGVLFSDPTAQVFAIDADLPSLAVTRAVCRHAVNVDRRLQLIRTLICSKTGDGVSLQSVTESTDKLLANPRLKIDPSTTNYVNLDTQINESELPRISLDSLLNEHLRQAFRPCLIKCDVEGAEQIVLEGAGQVLNRFRPPLLVSVHPPYLPKFGGSVEGIRNLLKSSGYEVNVIGIDHEEHWLCRHSGADPSRDAVTSN
ncbi:MAG: FkbM family methyltransferase [Planctomycetaceae bacterium]